MRAYLIALLAAAGLVAFDILSAPALIMEADGRREVLAAQIRDEVPLTVRFIHSVQKTPVEEFLTVRADGHFHSRGRGTNRTAWGCRSSRRRGRFAERAIILSSIWSVTIPR